MATAVSKNPGALAALAGKVPDNPKLKVGFLKGTYPDGTSVPQVAVWNEFGVAAHGQPPRPFFRRMIAAQSPKWGKMAAVLLKQNNMDIAQTLDIMGQEIQGRVKESINTLVDPPLAASTIARKKGNDKPLIDTALMLNSVSYVVTEE